MKKILAIIAVVLVGTFGILACVAPPPISTPSPEFTIPYTTFNGSPVELVVLPKEERVILRIVYHEVPLSTMIGDESPGALQFLKNEVMRLTATTDAMRLGNTDYFFQFRGGYPVWGPHYENRLNGERATCLLFSDHAHLRGKTVVAKGERTIIGYYPYPQR